MPLLHDVQQRFWRSIAGEPGRYAFDSAFVAMVESGPRLDAVRRVHVYADAYLSRLREGLAGDFPCLAKSLGSSGFEGLVNGYLRAHPSENPSVRHLGRRMAEFIEASADLPPYAADVARLEWARVDVFDAGDSSAIDIEDLLGIPLEAWPSLTFVPIPALQVIRAGWPVHTVWPDGGNGTIEPSATAIRVWRGIDFGVFHTAMDLREATAFDRMIAGESFSAICEVYSDLTTEEAAREATSILARWLSDGIIASAR